MQEMLCKIQKILEITKLTKSNSLVVLMSEKKGPKYKLTFKLNELILLLKKAHVK